MRRRFLVAIVTAGILAAGAPPALADEATPPAAPTDTTSPTAPASPSTPSTEEPPTPADPPAPPPVSAPVVETAQLPLRAGEVGWRVAKVQERLQWLGYEIYPGNLDNRRMGESTIAAVKKFQAKFGYRPTGVVGPGTWELLRDVSGTVGVLPKTCRDETSICIDKSQRLVRFVKDGRVRLTLDARFGFIGAETREGSFRVNRKSRDHVSSLYRTWMPFALFFAGGQAVHYSPYFARDGYNGGSHGCVNLRDFDRARWLFDTVPVGTRVHVYRS